MDQMGKTGVGYNNNSVESGLNYYANSRANPGLAGAIGSLFMAAQQPQQTFNAPVMNNNTMQNEDIIRDILLRSIVGPRLFSAVEPKPPLNFGMHNLFVDNGQYITNMDRNMVNYQDQT